MEYWPIIAFLSAHLLALLIAIIKFSNRFAKLETRIEHIEKNQDDTQSLALKVAGLVADTRNVRESILRIEAHLLKDRK
jgi:hypothetical protein